jgi:phosphate transport system protein
VNRIPKGHLRPRGHYDEELHALEAQTLGGIDLVVTSLDRVLEAVQNHDTDLAALVVADDDRIDGRYMEVHQSILSLLALQAPVASDLRLVAALLHVSRHLERMGDQCVNIAKLVPLSGDDPTVQPSMLDKIAEMGQIVRSLVVQAGDAFTRRDARLAYSLVEQDDRVDKLNRAIFQEALDIGGDPDVREWAMHTMLMGRALERIGDNAVDVGEQVAFVVTGLFREFADASHPVASD